jgi:hypothetical protein
LKLFLPKALDYIKKNEMGRAYSTYEEEYMGI